ncbi:MAG: hypothetical protein Q9167_003575 [Letrouitia subvulpina]
MTNGAPSLGPSAATRALSMSTSTGSMEYPQDVDISGMNGVNGMVKPEGEEAESDTDQVASSLGVLKVDNNKSMYYGDVHWASILQDIAEVKNFFAEHKNQLEDQAQKVQAAKPSGELTQNPVFLFGGSNPPEFSELLAALPKRAVVDQLVGRYFNSLDPAVHPKSMGPSWLGQIYAVLCLAMHSYYRMGDEPTEYRGKSLALASKYRSLTAQCLLRADFLKPFSYTIETLLLHLHGEYARSRDAEVGIWVLVGMIVRLAMRMGYHRDPKLFPNITPFLGEMRRRTWTFVRQCDLLFSFQIGLPSMIRLGDCDSALPSNLYDDDLHEDMKSLPLPRPITEPTPVSFMIAKSSITFTFGKIIEALHSVTPCSYEDIMSLDQDLREARAELPPHLRMKSMEESMLDPGAIIMQRFSLSILYNKGQCVLHRKFLGRARENNRYAHSRRTCVDSSMELLNHQATLHYENRPGRRLYGTRVYLSSLTTHDFLLAAMIVCLDLWYGAEADGAGRNSTDLYTWGLERRGDMIRALEVSNDIWKETRDQSMEAYKASEILTIMIDKMKYRSQGAGRHAPSPFPFPGMTNGDGTSTYGQRVEEKPEHSAAMTLGMLSSGGMTPNSGNMFNSGFPTGTGTNEIQASNLTPNFSVEQAPNGIPSAPSPFSFMPTANQGAEIPSNLDWDAWDSYIQNAGLDTGSQLWPPPADLPNTPAGMENHDPQLQQQQQSNFFAGNANTFASPPGNLPL